MSGQNPFKNIHTVTLPVSGARVRCRKPSLMTMVATGGLPSELTGMALNIAENKPVLSTGTSIEDVKRTFETVEAFIPYVLVDIKLVREGESKLQTMGDDIDGNYWGGTLNYADLQDVDKQYIFLVGRGSIQPWRVEGAEDGHGEKEATDEDLGKFRPDSSRDDAGRTGEEVRAEAEQSAGVVAREPVSP